MRQLRKATADDLAKINMLAKEAEMEMRRENVLVWRGDYPYCHFEADIAAGRMWVMEGDTGTILAAFSMREDKAGMEGINWRCPAAKTLYIERLVVYPFRDKAIPVTEVMIRLRRIAGETGAESLRLLEPCGNVPAVRAYKLAGFRYAEGDIGADDDDRCTIRKDCFEMKL